MDIDIRSVAGDDWNAITRIFNFYIESSAAAYPDEPVTETFFRDKHAAAKGYPFLVAECRKKLHGFAYLSPFHSAATMRRTATLTYFLHPESTGLGIGTQFLERLLTLGRDIGARTFLAHISSLNAGSIRFHLRHGFHECGRFSHVGEKHGQAFDMVWMQRSLK